MGKSKSCYRRSRGRRPRKSKSRKRRSRRKVDERIISLKQADKWCKGYRKKNCDGPDHSFYTDTQRKTKGRCKWEKGACRAKKVKYRLPKRSRSPRRKSRKRSGCR